jgi:tryptophan synthase alpha chain
MQAVATAGPAFLYGIAEVGVTGERESSGERVAALAASVRSVTDIPLVLGVGISTPEHAHRAALAADGVIVGSALVRLVLDAPDPTSAARAVGNAVFHLAAAVRR